MFFGPLSWATSLSTALTTGKSRFVRSGSAVFGASLLCAWLLVVGYLVVLLGGRNVFCPGLFDGDPCTGHGVCYGAGQCHCEIGRGPEDLNSEEPLCSRVEPVCTDDQIRMAVLKGDTERSTCDSSCCGGVGSCVQNEAGQGVCVCSGESTGERCEHDPCHPDGTLRSCAEHSHCVAKEISYSCECDEGWIGNATNCDHPIGCDSHPCQHGAPIVVSACLVEPSRYHQDSACSPWAGSCRIQHAVGNCTTYE